MDATGDAPPRTCAVLVALLLVLAGCGAGPGPTTTTEQTTTTATATTATATATTATATATATTKTTSTPTPTPSPGGAVELRTTVVDETYLKVTHAGGSVLDHRDISLSIWTHVASTGRGGLFSSLFTNFGPGDTLYAYRNSTGELAFSVDEPPMDPRSIEAMTSVSFFTHSDGEVVATTGLVNVGLEPVDATLSAELVDGMVKVTHEGGDTLRAGEADLVVTRVEDGAGTGTYLLFESDFSTGETAWIYHDQSGELAVVVGERPAPSQAFRRTVAVTVIGPTGERPLHTILDATAA